MFRRLVLIGAYLIAAGVGVFLLDGIALSGDRPDESCPAADSTKNILTGTDARLPGGKTIQNDRAVSLKSWLLPYCFMDEIFHVPQAAVYFSQGNLSYWDHMITTPAGAYFAAYSIMRPFFKLKNYAERIAPWLSQEQLSHRKSLEMAPLPQQIIISFWRIIDGWKWTPSDLATMCRATNCIVAALALAALLAALADYAKPRIAATGMKLSTSSEELMTKYVRDRVERCRRVMVPTALHICFYPTVFFFTALFYTEPMSLLALSLCFFAFNLFAPQDRGFWRWVCVAVPGVLAVLVRQTNIVWVAYFPASVLLDELLTVGATKQQTLSRVVGHILGKTLPRQLPVIALGVAFVAWAMLLNEGSIVLGDKSSHKPTVHAAQIPLMCCFLALFAPFQTLAAVWEWVSTRLLGHRLVAAGPEQKQNMSGSSNSSSRSSETTTSSPFWVTLLSNSLIPLVAAVFAGFARTMQFHPYLIADNRHYTFYLYRYILKKQTPRMLMCAVGGAAGLCLILRGTMRKLRLYQEGVDDVGKMKRAAAGKTTAANNNNKKKFEPPLPSLRPVVASLAHDILFLIFSAVVVVPQGLIEPRYFLVPAVFFMMRSAQDNIDDIVPLEPPVELEFLCTTPSTSPAPTPTKKSAANKEKEHQQQHDGEDEEALSEEEEKRRFDFVLSKLEARQQTAELGVESICKAQVFDVAVCLVIHVVTLYIFVFKTFEAPDRTIGRFMW